MTTPRVELYQRLPGIYRERDHDQEHRLHPDRYAKTGKGQLQSYLGLIERVFSDLHANIEGLYDDFFIESCADWVIPYLGDLLGTSHLKGDAPTLRADVADTIALRRRKGTLAGISQLAFNLTRWGVYSLELRDVLLWRQHLNHQRPDDVRQPLSRHAAVRGGTVTLRDPATLSLIDSPFDTLAHTVNVNPVTVSRMLHNIPNLAIFLWRLKDHRVPLTRPAYRGRAATGATKAGEATHVVRFDVHPLGRPVRLFNTYQFVQSLTTITELDRTPGPIRRQRLTSTSAAGQPQAYVSIRTYDPAKLAQQSPELSGSDVGLHLFVPEPEFAGEGWPGMQPERWSIRGANLCAWESGLRRPLADREVAVDPVIGRILVGVGNTGNLGAGTGESEANALRNRLLVAYTYGAAGTVGAHPVSRTKLPERMHQRAANVRTISYHADGSDALERALDDIHFETAPLVILINDSMVHELDIGKISGRIAEAGGFNLRLNFSLVIRATGGQRPIVRLKRPLRFRPVDPATADRIDLRFDGVFVTVDDSEFPAGEPLIARAAINEIHFVNCTLDPGGDKFLDGSPTGSRQPIQTALEFEADYGFVDIAEAKAFSQTPIVVLEETVSGPVLMDDSYELVATRSIIDAGTGVDEKQQELAIGHPDDADQGWGPPIRLDGTTVFGRTRVRRIRQWDERIRVHPTLGIDRRLPATRHSEGAIFTGPLEVHNNQVGCLRCCRFAPAGNRLPQNMGCVLGGELHFASELHGDPGYAHLTLTTDFEIRERGPRDDAMGAHGFLLEAHKWRNLNIRFREFMPVGVRPVLVPVT